MARRTERIRGTDERGDHRAMTAATTSQLLWYTTRATGLVALVLLTASVVIGVLTSVRFRTRAWPRFTFQDLHRRISLLAVVFVALHVITTVSDSFAPIGWVSAVVPFTSPYRRLWLGLGTVAVDLLLAVTISSLLRQRIRPGSWRALHWLAYASWPLAVFHGLGTGTDPHLGWVMALVVACVAAVLGAVGWRLVAGWPARAGVRVAAGLTSVTALIVLVAWTATGPLRPGWAVRAGTPAALLAHSEKSAAAGPASGPSSLSSPSVSGPSVSGPSVSGPSVSGPTTANLPAPPYRATFQGTISQRSAGVASVRIEIKAETSGALVAVLDVVIVGTPDGAGGVAMHQGQASFGPPGDPTRYHGEITGLEGSRILLSLTDDNGGQLNLRLDVAQSGTAVTGELASVAGPSGHGGSDDGN
jgi:methionine sulfoxide reductase heme-binding subunit